MIASLALMIWLAAAQDARAEPASPDRPIPAMPSFPPCSLAGATLVEHKTDLPADARTELDRLFAPIHGIADAGTFFNSTDVTTDDSPQARFLRAYHVQNIWFVWYERGGIGLERLVIALAPANETGKVVLRAQPGSNFVGNLCAGMKGYLSGARSAG